MQVDYFRDILVPVVGGLGIFMLGLECMSNGIQNLAVNRMRALLARIAGTPIKGVIAGTLITGVIQSSTAMTVMVVGLVNSGVLALRPAISWRSAAAAQQAVFQNRDRSRRGSREAGRSQALDPTKLKVERSVPTNAVRTQHCVASMC